MVKFLHDTIKGETHETDEHQHAAYWHLYDNRRAALFLEMSLSKTVTVLSFLHDEIRAGDIKRVLVVAPDKVARITWPGEIKKWEHLQDLDYTLIDGDPLKREALLFNSAAPVHIISETNLVWLLDQYVYQRVSKKTGRAYGSWLGSLPYDTIVIDEIDKFKNPKSVKFKKLRRALDKSYIPNRIGMTGTPLPNGYTDLWAPMCLLDDGDRLGEFYSDYLDEYFTPGKTNGMTVLNWKPRKGAIDTISNLISDIALTMKARDYIELPPERIIDELLEFAPFDQELYELLQKEYVIEHLADVTAKNAADLTSKLLQVTSGAIYGEDKSAVYQLNTLKIDALRQITARYPDENIIVAYQFRHELARILREFPDAVEFGKGKTAEQNFKDWNDGKIKMLVAHPASISHGLNLQYGGRRMVFTSPTWNMGQWLQMIARLVRRGVIDEVFIHRLLIRGTIDEKIAKRVKSKQTDQDFLFKIVEELKYAS